MQRGVDIEARHVTTGRKILIEAKGGTSSKSATNRSGQLFTPNQARSHVAVALLKALQCGQQGASTNDQVALALPDNLDHTRLVASVGEALTALGLAVFFVAEVSSVRLSGVLG